MIKSFKNKETEQLFNRNIVRKIPNDILKIAYRKLKMIDAAVNIIDLKIPPANCLEKLKGNREGQYSIRINKQWRMCFLFKGSDAYEVEIVDYHKG